jgi:hypothetical protein
MTMTDIAFRSFFVGFSGLQNGRTILDVTEESGGELLKMRANGGKKASTPRSR